MRLVVASCWAYRDAWNPFFALLDKFWPNHPKATIITDIDGGSIRLDQMPADVKPVSVFVVPTTSTWCQAVAEYAATTDEPILIMQEDFFLTAPVNQDLIQRGLKLLEDGQSVGCVRLYPCPGGDCDYGDEHFAEVDWEAPYRISCQAAIWRPDYLKRVADDALGSAASFEIAGTQFAKSQNDIVLAFKRDVQPWPMQYICSGISRGMWNPDSKKLCDLHGIENDWSMRPFAS